MHADNLLLRLAATTVTGHEGDLNDALMSVSEWCTNIHTAC